jgi:mono/diheme cytochrome c family protein
MYTRITFFLFAAVAASIVAAQTPTVRIVPVSRTSPASGQEMFNNYCAACHGKQGRGDGPAAAAMTKVPPDLSRIAARNNGKFPDLHVLNAISGNEPMAAHGSADMPAWGEVLRSLNSGTSDTVLLRLSNLTDYVKSLQVK